MGLQSDTGGAKSQKYLFLCSVGLIVEFKKIYSLLLIKERSVLNEGLNDAVQMDSESAWSL